MTIYDSDSLEYIIQMPYKPDEAMFTHICVTYTLACMKGDAVTAMRSLKFLSMLAEELGGTEYMREPFERLRRLLAHGHPQVESCTKSGRHCHCDSLFCCLCGQPKITFTLEGEVHD